MGTKAKEWVSLTEWQLSRLVGPYPEAAHAEKQVEKIKSAGHVVSIFYSGFNGFSVLDENDPKQFQLALSLRQCAKPWKSGIQVD
jgi:hypothetical protein